MPIPANQIRVAEVIMYGLIDAEGSGTKNTVTVYHFRRLGVAVNPVKTNLDTIFQSTIADKVVLALNARWTQLRNSVRWVDDAQDAPLDINHANPGAIGTISQTSNETVYVRLRTALRGRRYRGAKYFGPISDADATAGASDVLNAAAITRFNAIITGLGTDLAASEGNTWRLCILSRQPPSQLLVNPTTVVYNDVTQISLNTRIGDMKRRKVASVY